MHTRVIIVANGYLYDGILKEIHAGDYVIGVDRAAYWLLTHAVRVDAAIGDFDSTNRKELAVIRTKVPDIHTFPAEKDFIDTELALQVALKRKPKEILILGGEGTRRDHALGVLLLLDRFARYGIPITVRTATSDVQLLRRGRTILKQGRGYRYVSMIPVSSYIRISLQGFKYNLSRKIIRRGQTIGISNEFIGSRGEVTVHSGKAFIVQSRD